MLLRCEQLRPASRGFQADQAGCVTVVSLLSLGTAYLNWQLPILRLTVEGEPILLLEDWRPIERNLRRQRITLAELAAQARQERHRQHGRGSLRGAGDVGSDRFHHQDLTMADVSG